MNKQGTISFCVAVLMSINIIVGGGIFSGPQSMTAAVGSISFLTWLFVGILMFPMIWGIAQASRLFPESGGFYNYCSSGINQTTGFIAQWTYMLGYIGTAATMITLLQNGLIHSVGLTSFTKHPYLLNAIIITFFSLLNLLSINIVSKIQSGATILKLLPIFFVISILGWYWNPNIFYNTSNLCDLGLAIPAAIFGYWGFEACCSLGDHLKDGPQSVGKVILTAFFITVLIYTFFHFGLLQIMGVEGLSSQGPMAFPLFLGISSSITSIASVGIIGAIMLSYANSIFGVSLGNVSNIVTLAQNKLIIGSQTLTKINKFSRPTVATCIHAIIVWLLLCIISNLKILFAFTNIGIASAIFLTLISVFLKNINEKNTTQIVVTILGFISCKILMYYCWISIGLTTTDRLLNLSPMLFGNFIGLAMYTLRPKKQNHT